MIVQMCNECARVLVSPNKEKVPCDYTGTMVKVSNETFCEDCAEKAGHGVRCNCCKKVVSYVTDTCSGKMCYSCARQEYIHRCDVCSVFTDSAVINIAAHTITGELTVCYNCIENLHKKMSERK